MTTKYFYLPSVANSRHGKNESLQNYSLNASFHDASSCFIFPFVNIIVKVSFLKREFFRDGASWILPFYIGPRPVVWQHTSLEGFRF